MTCAREALGEHLHTSNIPLSEREKKNLVGIFINGANTLSLEENIKLFSAVQKFILNSGRFTYDATNYTHILNYHFYKVHAPANILPKARLFLFPEVNINIHLICLL